MEEITGVNSISSFQCLKIENSEKFISLCQKYSLQLVVLFGSQAKGTARKESDYDVGALRHNGIIPPQEFLKIAYELSRALSMPNLHLVDLCRASGLLKHRVAEEGVVLYEGEQGIFNSFRVLAFKLYHDERIKLRRFDSIYIEESLRRLRDGSFRN